MKPNLVIVSGLPGAGKTTLAERLAKDLGYFFVNKDTILETLWEQFEWNGDQKELPKFRNATYALLYDAIRRAGQAGISLVVESNFDNSHTADVIQVAEEAGLNIVYIHCNVTPQTAFARFKERQDNGGRNKYHPARNTFEEFKSVFIEGKEEKMQLPGKIMELEMEDFSKVNYLEVLAFVKIA